MNLFIVRVKALLPLYLCLSVFSCGAHGESFKNAATQYCNLYAPSSWEALGDEADLQTIYSYIVRESRKIDNAQFIKSLDDANTKDFATFSASVRENIEAQLGNKWQCDFFDNFFYPKQKVVFLSISDITERRIDPNSPNVMVIMLLASGEVVVNNAPLENSSAETIKKAIGMLLGNMNRASTDVYVYFDQGADGGMVSKLLALLSGLGINHVGLIDYSD
jgi:biopolymer transport protein ExbD